MKCTYKPFDEMPIICLMRKSALKLVVWPLKFPLIFPIHGNGDDWAQSLSFNLDRISWIVISVVNEHEAPWGAGRRSWLLAENRAHVKGFASGFAALDALSAFCYWAIKGRFPALCRRSSARFVNEFAHNTWRYPPRAGALRRHAQAGTHAQR